jgi:hypothetical protein
MVFPEPAPINDPVEVPYGIFIKLFTPPPIVE